MARQANIDKLLADLVETFKPRIRDAFLASIQDVKDNVVLSQVVQAVIEGDAERAFQLLGLSEAAMRPLVRAMEDAFEAGGLTTASTFPKQINFPSGKAVFRFDTRNSRAEAWLRDQSSRLVQDVREDTRQIVRDVLSQGMREGRNPRDVATDLVGKVDAQQTAKRRIRTRTGGIIGLDSRRASWVNNAAQELRNLDPSYLGRKLRDRRFDGIVKKAIADGKPLSDADVEKIMLRYKDRVLKYRADTIARTEAIAALNRSEWEAISQVVDEGGVEASDVIRTWDSAGRDGRTRHTHLIMDGQIVGLNEPFVTPGGSRLMYPGDTSLGAPASETINCRCIARTRVNFLAKVQKIEQSEAEREETLRMAREAGLIP